MKVFFNKRFSFILTFALHYVILDFIWTEMENAIYGHTMPSTEDSMILILFVLYVTFILWREEKNGSTKIEEFTELQNCSFVSDKKQKEEDK